MLFGKKSCRGFWIVAGLAAMLALAPLAAGATCGVNWTNATNISTGSYLRAVIYGAGKYVAVGDNGTIITSVDGNYWTPQATGTTDGLWSVVYEGGKFVAVGGKTTLTSTDGQAWNKKQITSVDDLRGLAYGNGLYVAVGLNANIITSPDGVTWTTMYHYDGIDLYGISFQGGRFVAVGQWGWTCTSEDGITFLAFPTNVLTNLRSITYGDGQWVCVGDNGTAFTSPDGLVWTQQDPHTQKDLYDILHANGLYIAVGVLGTIVHSTDAIVWDIASSPSQSDMHGVGYGGDRFIVVGQAAALTNACKAVHLISGEVVTESGSPVGNVQLQLSGSASDVTHTENDGTYSFANLADGAYTVTPSSSGSAFTPASLNVTLSGQDATGRNFVMTPTVNPPVITAVLKASNPFRLKVMGSNFHSGACSVRVNGVGVATVYKNSGLLVAKNVASLIPKGTTVQITVINTDDGGVSGAFPFTR
jgi:hypothetical protein